MQRVLLAAISAIFGISFARADTYLVLPFFNVSNNTRLDWIGEGLAETVQEALSAEGLIVLDRDDRVEAYRRLSIRPYSLLTKASVMKIGEELDAAHVVFGEFNVTPVPGSSTKSRGSLQITARVLDLKGMRVGPQFRESGAIEDLAALQNHLAWQALQAVSRNTVLTEADFQERHPPVRLDAIENYIRGLLAANPDDKHRLFTQAARLDPHYSQPCFQLGRAAVEEKGIQNRGRLVPARESVRCALSPSQFLSGTVPLLQRGLLRRADCLPIGCAHGSAGRSAQRSGCG